MAEINNLPQFDGLGSDGARFVLFRATYIVTWAAIGEAAFACFCLFWPSPGWPKASRFIIASMISTCEMISPKIG